MTVAGTPYWRRRLCMVDIVNNVLLLTLRGADLNYLVHGGELYRSFFPFSKDSLPCLMLLTSRKIWRRFSLKLYFQPEIDGGRQNESGDGKEPEEDAQEKKSDGEEPEKDGKVPEKPTEKDRKVPEKPDEEDDEADRDDVQSGEDQAEPEVSKPEVNKPEVNKPSKKREGAGVLNIFPFFAAISPSK